MVDCSHTRDDARFASHCAARGACLEWTGNRLPTGYARFWYDGAKRYAHRWIYERLIGPIPPGLEIDHLCRNVWCVNVLHLEPVTGRVNKLRGTGFAAVQAARTHCPQGHPYAGDNLVLDQGKRKCRACMRARSLEAGRRWFARYGYWRYGSGPRPDVVELATREQAGPFKADVAESQRTHCPQGHRYEGDNLIIERGQSGPKRKCRICKLARNRDWHRRYAAENGRWH